MYKSVVSEYVTLEEFFIDNKKFIELDLGCGKGGFTIALAERFPNRQIIGADIMLGRIRRLSNRIENHFPDIKNVMLFRSSATELIGFQLPRFSIDRVHILCPDPWPKTRHRANRLLCSEFFGHLSNIIKIGGTLHISTDDKPYLSFILEAIDNCRFFERNINLISDVADMKTDFERLWEKEGKITTHLAYRRTEVMN